MSSIDRIALGVYDFGYAPAISVIYCFVASFSAMFEVLSSFDECYPVD